MSASWRWICGHCLIGNCEWCAREVACGSNADQPFRTCACEHCAQTVTQDGGRQQALL